MKKIVVLLTLFILVCLFKIWYFDNTTLITVVGNGTVTATPTIVKFNVNLVNYADSPTTAIADNVRLTQNSILVLKNGGVSEKDISVAYTRIVPPGTTFGQTKYQAVNSIRATLNQIGGFDALFTQLYANGVSSITDIVFSAVNPKDFEKQAVAEAFKDAQSRAKEVARLSGKSVVRMISIVTGEVGDSGALSGKTSPASGIQSVSPSSIEIARQASIVFELR